MEKLKIDGIEPKTGPTVYLHPDTFEVISKEEAYKIMVANPMANGFYELVVKD